MKTYKKRMVEEYRELKERYDKLDAITVKAEAGMLGCEGSQNRKGPMMRYPRMEGAL